MPSALQPTASGRKALKKEMTQFFEHSPSKRFHSKSNIFVSNCIKVKSSSQSNKRISPQSIKNQF